MKIKVKRDSWLMASSVPCYPTVYAVRGSQDYDIEHYIMCCPDKEQLYGPLTLKKDEVIDITLKKDSYNFDYIRDNKTYYFRALEDKDFFDKFEIISD